MKHSDYYAFAINGAVFLIFGGFMGGLALAHGMWIPLILCVAFIGIGAMCVLAVAESAREKHRER